MNMLNQRRWKMEEYFRIMKSVFQTRPVYLKLQDCIAVHFITCFISLIFYKYLELFSRFGHQTRVPPPACRPVTALQQALLCFFSLIILLIFYIIHLVNITLATVPAKVASSAPVKVYLVFVTFAARKYTLIV